MSHDDIDLGCSGGLYGAGKGGCVAVGEGFFSPTNDSSRYPCLPGTFSNVESATFCEPCPPGSYMSEEQATGCIHCQEGSYTSNAGSYRCEWCDPLYYSGLASDFAIFLPPPPQSAYEGDVLYCLEPLDGPVYAQPSISPTTDPTLGTTSAVPTPASFVSTDTPTGAHTAEPTIASSFIPSFATTKEPFTATTPPPGTVSPTLEETVYPGILDGPDEDLSGVADGASWETIGLSHYLLPALIAILLAIAMGLAVIWSFPRAADETVDEEECVDDESDFSSIDSSQPRSNIRDESVSNVFYDADEREVDTSNLRAIKTGSALSRSAAEVWSMSAPPFGAPDSDSFASSSLDELGWQEDFLSL